MRILIADDNQLVRQGVRSILLSQARYEVCGEASDAEETVRMVRELLPDLVLLDISMPGQSGLEASRRIRDELPGVRVIIMSQHDPVQLLPLALGAGADGCVDKGRLTADLLASIESIAGTPETHRVGNAD